MMRICSSCLLRAKSEVQLLIRIFKMENHFNGEFVHVNPRTDFCFPLAACGHE